MAPARHKGRLLAALLLVPGMATARDLPLAQPIDCTLGDTCHIQNLVDHDPGDGFGDFACGSLGYDGHKGTDFALPSLTAMVAGVDVLAAAPGTVRAVRDGEPDIAQTSADAPDVSGKECGNGLVISHGDGWETQYCHMARGSIVVEPGQRVGAGTVLGRVGLSGQTQFPHLHLAVRQDGEVIDPFDPDGTITCGVVEDDSLWTTITPAPPGGLIASGFATAVPDYDDIKAGTAGTETLATTDPALVFWAYAYGARPGDVLHLTITGPDGDVVFDNEDVIDRIQAQFFRAGGRRIPGGGWVAGDYTGTALFLRDGKVLDTLTHTIPVRN